MPKPVDMSDNFREKGWEYCKYLITDPRSDRYLRNTDESSELDPPLQEGEETKT